MLKWIASSFQAIYHLPLSKVTSRYICHLSPPLPSPMEPITQCLPTAPYRPHDPLCPSLTLQVMFQEIWDTPPPRSSPSDLSSELGTPDQDGNFEELGWKLKLTEILLLYLFVPSTSYPILRINFVAVWWTPIYNHINPGHIDQDKNIWNLNENRLWWGV